VISDASSCTEGLRKTLPDHGLEVVDAVGYALTTLLPRLIVAGASAQYSSAPPAQRRGFAGDRGLLVPELTAAATGPRRARSA
jgi:D-lactate dehydrogenase